MKALMMLAVLMAAVVANAEVKTYNVACQKAGFESDYSFIGSGTVTFDVDGDQADEITVDKIQQASMPYLVVTSPEGTFSIRNASMNENDKNNAYTIPASDQMGETIVIKMNGQGSGVEGELQMILKGPRTGGTSKIIAGKNIYWSNCQIVR